MFFSLLFPLYNKTNLIDLNHITFRPDFVSASSNLTSVLRTNYSNNPIIYSNNNPTGNLSIPNIKYLKMEMLYEAHHSMFGGHFGESALLAISKRFFFGGGYGRI
jgi:hypothetical protein